MSAIDAALALYKSTLSPVFAFFGARCRHYPTCSDYAAGALKRHGATKGGVLMISRLCRCHPFGSRGYDPVPEHIAEAGWKLWRYGDWAWTERGVTGDAAPAQPVSADREPLRAG